VTPEFLAQLRSHVSAEAYRHLPPDDLWARVRDDLDEIAFRVLLERVGGRVYRRCRAVLGDPHLADEAFQDTFRDLVRKRALIPTYRSAAAWAYQAATNHARRLRRARWRQITGGGVERAAAGGGDPLAGVDATDAADRALAGLPDRYRRPIELVFWDGLTHAEAAVVLGWSKGTVDSYVARGLRRLRAGAARYGLPAAGAAAVEGILARPAAALSDEVLADVARGALSGAGVPAAAAPGWAAWKAVAVVAAIGATAAVGVWWGRSAATNPVPSPPPSPPAVAAAPAESLQERNLRITRDELVGPLRDGLQKFYPPDNPVVLDGLRAYGSEVEVEFRLTRPVPAATGLASRFRARYCTFRRQLVIRAQPDGDTQWYTMNPDKPFSLSLPLPFGKPRELVRGREEYEAAKRLFDRLPPDPRAESELVKDLFGGPGELVLPAERAGLSSFPGGLLVKPYDGGLFVRDRAGSWRYCGECPSWFPVSAVSTCTASTTGSPAAGSTTRRPPG
jgi:RNA polymerase sigma factor (sigma-70 family)